MSALLFLMKLDDKDLSFKASLWLLNYHFQLLYVKKTMVFLFHYGFVFVCGSSIRGSEILCSLVMLVFL